MQMFLLLIDLIPLDECSSSEESCSEEPGAWADEKSNEHEDTEGKRRSLVEEEPGSVCDASALDVEFSFLGGRKNESILELLPL